MTRRLDKLPPEIAGRLVHKVACDERWRTRAELGKLGDPLLLCGHCGAYAVMRDETVRAQLLAELGLADSTPKESGADLQSVTPRPAPVPRAHLACVRCGTSFAARPGRPVIPLCPRCKGQPKRPRPER